MAIRQERRVRPVVSPTGEARPEVEVSYVRYRLNSSVLLDPGRARQISASSDKVEPLGLSHPLHSAHPVGGHCSKAGVLVMRNVPLMLLVTIVLLISAELKGARPGKTSVLGEKGLKFDCLYLANLLESAPATLGARLEHGFADGMRRAFLSESSANQRGETSTSSKAVAFVLEFVGFSKSGAPSVTYLRRRVVVTVQQWLISHAA